MPGGSAEPAVFEVLLVEAKEVAEFVHEGDADFFAEGVGVTIGHVPEVMEEEDDMGGELAVAGLGVSALGAHEEAEGVGFDAGSVAAGGDFLEEDGELGGGLLEFGGEGGEGLTDFLLGEEEQVAPRGQWGERGLVGCVGRGGSVQGEGDGRVGRWGRRDSWKRRRRSLLSSKKRARSARQPTVAGLR